MKRLRFSSQYKKDAKRFRNQPQKMAKVVEVLQMLINEIPIPPHYKPHLITGNYKGCMECHI